MTNKSKITRIKKQLSEDLDSIKDIEDKISLLKDDLIALSLEEKGFKQLDILKQLSDGSTYVLTTPVTRRMWGNEVNVLFRCSPAIIVDGCWKMVYKKLYLSCKEDYLVIDSYSYGKQVSKEALSLLGEKRNV